MAPTNVDIVRELFAAFERGDEEAMLALADPDVEIEPAWDSLTMVGGRGREVFLEFFRVWPSFWHEYCLETAEFVEAGDKVVVVLRERGLSRPGFSAVEDEFAHVWTIRDGKAAAVRVFSEPTDALRAAGLKRS